MKECVKCKTYLQDEAHFCSVCGVKQDSVGMVPKEESKSRKKKKPRKISGLKIGVIAVASLFGIYLIAVFVFFVYWKIDIEKDLSWELEYDVRNSTEIIGEPEGYEYLATGWSQVYDRECGLIEEFDEKGRLINWYNPNSTSDYNNNTIFYREDGDGNLVCIRYHYKEGRNEDGEKWYMYFFKDETAFDSNGEAIYAKRYKGERKISFENFNESSLYSDTAVEWILYSSTSYPTLLKDGTYNDTFGWWEWEEESSKQKVIWITDEEGRIVWKINHKNYEDFSLPGGDIMYNLNGHLVSIFNIGHADSGCVHPIWDYVDEDDEDASVGFWSNLCLSEDEVIEKEYRNLIDHNIGYDAEGRPRCLRFYNFMSSWDYSEDGTICNLKRYNSDKVWYRVNPWCFSLITDKFYGEEVIKRLFDSYVKENNFTTEKK